MSSSSRDLRKRILDLLGKPRYQPLDKVELSKALGIDSSDRRLVRDTLDHLENDGEIVRIRKDRYTLPDSANLVTGVFQGHVNGSAHIVNEKPGQADLYVAAQNTGIALHGDKVVARISHEGREQRRNSQPDRVEGRIIRILQRANRTMVGTLQATPKGLLYVMPDDARLPHDVYVVPGSVRLPQRPQKGDKVVVKLAPWELPHASPEGEIIEVLGPAFAPGVDMLSVIRKYGLPQEFPAAVLRDAERVPETVDAAEIPKRMDLRDQFIFTIDPDDAKDFDDAIQVEKTQTGWRLGVHIADVSHYVSPGSSLDEEAVKRGNSTYLADRVVPMLPERLSNGVCSLKPHVDRLVFSAFIEVTGDGAIKGASFGRSVIRSAARLSYRQALSILKGEKKMPPLSAALEKETRGQATISDGPPVPIDPTLAKQVRLAWDLASALRRRRFLHGSLDLDFPEVKVWLDADGKAVRLEKIENDISHQLIEECMLAANEVVARELKSKGIPALYRVHEDPDPDRLQDFREQAAIYGVQAGDLTSRAEVQKLLAAIRLIPEQYALKIAFLKSLKRAMYGIAPLGHYGLAKVNYTHFTSPIRRYSDLVVHRSLADLISPPKAAQGEKKAKRAQPASVAKLSEIAVHLSTTERNSSDAERDSVQLKKMEYFLRQAVSKKKEEFRATVTDVRTYGLFVELPDANISGVVHVSELPDDFYEFDSVRLSFTGRSTQRKYKLGDELRVTVSRVDVRKRQIDFSPVLGPTSGRGRKPDSTAPKRQGQAPSPRGGKSPGRAGDWIPLREEKGAARPSSDRKASGKKAPAHNAGGDKKPRETQAPAAPPVSAAKAGAGGKPFYAKFTRRVTEVIPFQKPHDEALPRKDYSAGPPKNAPRNAPMPRAGGGPAKRPIHTGKGKATDAKSDGRRKR